VSDDVAAYNVPVASSIAVDSDVADVFSAVVLTAVAAVPTAVYVLSATGFPTFLDP
jgi:hypothetical protein